MSKDARRPDVELFSEKRRAILDSERRQRFPALHSPVNTQLKFVLEEMGIFDNGSQTLAYLGVFVMSDALGSKKCISSFGLTGCSCAISRNTN
jgi:hypothetical protein